ncbi:MAG: hydantoinase/oxoprolinase family protein, partial [Planctomycetales bacterium]|nr:hydantoinase/oxoprolinase family protein [Planctomycetales bacterium]
MSLRISADTGGTFTDLVLFDQQEGRLQWRKTASTPADPSRALVSGIDGLAAQRKGGVALLVHGTTVATNAVLQRRGAAVALVTTRGFRDVLQIQRQDRPRLYDLRARRAEPLVPRRLRFELEERILYDGRVRTPLDPAELDQLVQRLRDAQVEAVAVGLLHSYANPAHELQVGQVLAQQLPGVTVCLSHEVVGEHGEYERFSTCAMNAFLQPGMQTYLGRLETALQDQQVEAPLFVMKSNGGVMAGAVAGRQAVHTLLSGPAGGVVAGMAIARGHDHPHLITADMGGTSFDVAVLPGGHAAFARDNEIAGLAVGVPMLDIHTVGAGGGSIAWIDAGGSLRVGPQSAGALPGPASYGRGGTLPTVTDANLVLGRLSTDAPLGGEITLDLDAAQAAIHDHLAGPLGLDLIAAAEGVIRVVNATMTRAIGRLSVERGLDPRQFVLCPFGGAGPLHGAELAKEMGIGQTLVPLAPGVTSALGLLM